MTHISSQNFLSGHHLARRKADTLETLFPVDRTLERMRGGVHETGACLARGGAVTLSPADDLRARIERLLISMARERRL